MENGLFIHYLSHFPGPLSFYTALEKTPFFYNNFFGFGWEAFSLPPAGAPGWTICPDLG